MFNLAGNFILTSVDSILLTVKICTETCNVVFKTEVAIGSQTICSFKKSYRNPKGILRVQFQCESITKIYANFSFNVNIIWIDKWLPETLYFIIIYAVYQKIICSPIKHFLSTSSPHLQLSFPYACLLTIYRRTSTLKVGFIYLGHVWPH